MGPFSVALSIALIGLYTGQIIPKNVLAQGTTKG